MFSKTSGSQATPKRITTYGKATRRPATSATQAAGVAGVPVQTAQPSIWDVQDDDELSAPQFEVARPVKRMGTAKMPTMVSTRSPIQESNGEKATATPKPRPTMRAIPLSQSSASNSTRSSPTRPRDLVRRQTSATRHTTTSTYKIEDRRTTQPQARKVITYNRSKSDVTVRSREDQSEADKTPRMKSGKEQDEARSQPVASMDYELSEPYLHPVVSPSRPRSQTTPMEPPPTKRRRLIDALAAQASSDIESSSDGESEGEEQDLMRQMRRTTPEPRLESEAVLTDTNDTPNRSLSRENMYQDSSRKRAGPKFTYGAARKVLEEEELPMDADPIAVFEQSLMPETTNPYDLEDDSDDEPSGTGAMRSIHELRQAGANSRFADELEDIMHRVGKPGRVADSSRRNALLTLAQKLQDKPFCRQFREHSGAYSMFEHIDRGADVLTGFLLLVIAATLLNGSSDSRLVTRLCSNKVVELFKQLLGCQDDVVEVAKEKSLGLSRLQRQTVAKLKVSILRMPVMCIWEAESLSPARLSLIVMDLVLQRSSIASSTVRTLVSSVASSLFKLVGNYTRQEASQAAENNADVYFSLSVLEPYSVIAMQSDDCDQWIQKYMPMVAIALEQALCVAVDGTLGRVELLLLKLAMNIANNNRQVSVEFARRGITVRLARLLCHTFEATISHLEVDKAAFGETLPTLLLMLGGMINLCEHDQAGDAKAVTAEAEFPLDRLIRLFLSTHSSQTDKWQSRGSTPASESHLATVEKGQLHVATSYLALLLGYLCLEKTVRDKYRRLQGNHDLAPLVDSIRAFIALHQATEEHSQDQRGADEKVNGTITKLQLLVTRLEEVA